MSPNAEKVAAEALGLPREQRAFLAEKLLESLDYEESFTLTPAWRDEVTRRCRELDSEGVALISGDEVLEQIARTLQ